MFLTFSLFALFISQTPAVPTQTPIVVSVQSLKWIVQEFYPDAQIEVLCPPGVSPHSFEVKPEQLKLASKARFGLSVSSEYDPWFDRIEISRKSSALSLLPKEFRQQSQFGCSGHSHPDHHHSHLDPHFWMDPITVKELLGPLTKQMCQWDPTNCNKLEQRAKDFSTRLDLLHQETEKLMKDVRGRAFLASHDGFGYFVRRYGLDYIEPIEPLPGKEPSPKDLKRLLEVARDKKVGVIFGEVQLPLAPIQSLAEAGRMRMEVLDQYGASKHIQSYSDLLLDNAKKIRSALEPLIVQ